MRQAINLLEYVFDAQTVAVGGMMPSALPIFDEFNPQFQALMK